MTGDDTSALPQLQAIAGEAFALLDTGHQIPPFSARFSALDLDGAYRVTAAIKQMRETRGEIPVGRLGTASSRRCSRPRSDQSSARGGRDRHDGNADARTSGVGGRDMDDRTYGCRD
jgi:hypothetical protein